MILVDTSAWIAFFRGSTGTADQVARVLTEGTAAWCGPIRTELVRGFASDRERNRVLPMLDACHWLEQPPDLWSFAGELGRTLRRRGVTVKTFDLLIATYALFGDVALLTCDGDFAAMQRHGVNLTLLG